MPLLYIMLLQLYYQGNFGSKPCVFTGASSKSGQSSRPLMPDCDLMAKMHRWSESWKTDKCPFVHYVVHLKTTAKNQHYNGRSHWLLFIDAVMRHLQASQQAAQDEDDSEEY